MTSGIYGIFQGNRVYIGQSSGIDHRWETHKSDLKLNKHHCQFLQRVYNKYGLSSLQFSTLEVCQLSGLDDLETKVWEDYEAKGFTMMNSKPEGGVLRGENHPHYGRKLSPYQREKFITSGKDHHMFGRTHTDEAKAKISKAGLGRTHTAEAKAKIAERSKGENNPMFGMSGDKNPRFGIAHTAETKDKMSKSSVKYWYTIQHVKSGEIFTTDNITIWCESKKVCRNHLYSTVPGGSRKTSQGYKIISKVEL